MPHDKRMPLPKSDFSAAISELKQIIQNNKIPNALLFTGHPGAGRKQAAFRFAKAVNCLSDNCFPCNRCRSCKKIDNQMHPDMILVDLPDKKKVITISQIREIAALTAARPNEARYRMVLISNACHMNTQAQNALLKELEEPPENTFFILMARDRTMLLPTITSRCRHLRFNPLTGRALADHLSESFKTDPQSAHIIAATAGSDLGLAMTLLNLPDPGSTGEPADRQNQKPQAPGTLSVDWQASRTWLIRQLCRLILGPSAKKIETALSLSWQLSLDPNDILPCLAVMRAFFRDLCIVRYAPEKIVNLDFLDTFQDIGSQVSDRQCLFWMTTLHETEKRLTSNSSVRMTMDRFLLKMIHI
ncbi:MAG: DNA polymerase III subunit delta' [Desulfotignum sp.]|nr:DNA polymerase III subunit delta' [Desulfotignum sp.]